jgi:hypothetical protein
MELKKFIEELKSALAQNQFIKATLANKIDKNSILKNVFIKPVLLKNKLQLNFVYRNNTNDITKNFEIESGLDEIENLLKTTFRNADAFTTTHELHLMISKNNKATLIKKATKNATEINLSHDHIKHRLVQTTANSYLHALGISNADGHIKTAMQAKYKQINRYIEIVADILKDIPEQNEWHITDMGSGKGYLTFALYDYLRSQKNTQANITGVEMRSELVKKCNNIAQENKFDTLHFVEGTIQNTALKKVDMLIALHACDTATDDAIAKGIEADAALIICAPCCHKQVRKDMHTDGVLKSITKHGILLERQAEILTDTIRALLLESKGYKTRVFDFIDWEHTPKNVLIVAQKSTIDKATKAKCITKIHELKKLFGLEKHYLEGVI